MITSLLIKLTLEILFCFGLRIVMFPSSETLIVISFRTILLFLFEFYFKVEFIGIATLWSWEESCSALDMGITKNKTVTKIHKTLLIRQPLL